MSDSGECLRRWVASFCEYRGQNRGTTRGCLLTLLPLSESVAPFRIPAAQCPGDLDPGLGVEARGWPREMKCVSICRPAGLLLDCC